MTNSKLDKKGATIGALLGVVLVLALIVCTGLWVHHSRQRMLEAGEAMQADLTTAQARIEDLEKQVLASREAREQVEAKANEATMAADQARQDSQRQRDELQNQIKTLKANVQEAQQQIVVAHDATTKIQAELASATEQRTTAENEIAKVRSQLDEQKTLMSERQNPGITPTEARPGGSRPATTAAAKQSFSDGNPAGGTAGLDTPPQPVALASPDYPDALKRQRKQGYVVVAFTVDTRGRVTDVEVQESSNAGFDAAAVAAVRQWQFKPAQRDGEPVEAHLSQRLEFKSK